MALQLDCPSCGASVKVKRNEKSVVCDYCGNSILVPDYVPDSARKSNTVAFGQSCGKIAFMIAVGAVLLSLGLGVLVFYLVSPDSESDYGYSSSSYTLPLPEDIILEFGGAGTAPGFFHEPCFITLDKNNNIIIGERETGRIQTFDSFGNFLFQWQFAGNQEVLLQGMSYSGEGRLFIVRNGGLYSYDAASGQLIDSLMHPDGIGFSDIDVAYDGSILASWYGNHDDIIKFNNQGEVEFIVENAISGQSGDSELSTKVIAGNLGDIYAYGSFNKAIFKFNSEGVYQDRFGNDDLFTMPQGFEVDNLGRLWVSDIRELLVFSDSGELTYRIETGYVIKDFVITSDKQLYGITSEETVVQINVSNY